MAMSAVNRNGGAFACVRVVSIACRVAIIVCGVVSGCVASVAPTKQVDRGAWVQRITDLELGGARNWRAAFTIGQDVANLPPADGIAIITEAWPKLTTDGVKQQIIKAWQFELPAPFRVRFHPQAFAFFDLVLRDDDAMVSEWVLGYLPRYAWRTFADAAEARRWLAAQGDTSPQQACIDAMTQWHVRLSAAQGEHAIKLLAALEQVGYPFRRNLELQRAAHETGFTATLERWIDDERVPAQTAEMIYSTLMDLAPDRYTREGLTAFITKLSERESRQLDAKVRTIDGDARKAWILHGPQAEAAPPPPPKDGYGLLLVMPGGDGSRGFADFVGADILQAVGKEYLVAQLIAPPIAESDADAVVWPTAGLPDDRVDFTIEPVADAVVAQARQDFPIDPTRVFVMGWSSGGPPAYALTMRSQSPFRGAFVIMSVFKPEHLPPPAGAKDRSFFILHSPQDFITMDFPNDAKRTLGDAGARVTLETYEGGHGWHGDVSDQITRAVRWLEGR